MSKVRDHFIQSMKDQIIGGIRTITAFHSKIHDGVAFDARHTVTTLATGATYDLLLQVPTTHAIHLRFIFEATNSASGYLYENPTFSDAGDAVLINSLNRRDYAQSTHATLTSQPTVSSVGSVVVPRVPIFGSGQGGKAVGGQKGGFEEVVLKEGNNYLLRIASDHNQDISVHFETDFYEQAL